MIDGQVGVPDTGIAGASEARMQAYYAELCPRFLKSDVRSMLSTLVAQKAIEDMKFLKYLSEAELKRMLPKWVADDVRKLKR